MWKLYRQVLQCRSISSNIYTNFSALSPRLAWQMANLKPPLVPPLYSICLILKVKRCRVICTYDSNCTIAIVWRGWERNLIQIWVAVQNGVWRNTSVKLKNAYVMLFWFLIWIQQKPFWIQVSFVLLWGRAISIWLADVFGCGRAYCGWNLDSGSKQAVQSDQ